MNDELPLAGVRVVSLAINVPGPAAAARLRDLGASVTKVEPPGGDFLALSARPWYDDMCRGQRVLTLNLKDARDAASFDELLSATDILIVSSRPSALARLGVTREGLAERHAALCVVSIVGHVAPDEELAGHDLTYQSEAGLIGSAMPATLIADMAAAEESVTEALALLHRRARTGLGGWATVALRDAARRMALPRRYGLTIPSGVLGGALPEYSLYQTSSGTLAVAALERHFAERLGRLLQLPVLTHEGLAAALAARTAAEWAEWGRAHDVPMAEVPAEGEAPGAVDT